MNMKKILSIILTISLSICMLFTLSGCAGVYDILNFNRKALPNPDSPIEEGLENKYQKQNSALTANEFANLFKASFDERVAYEDTLNVSYLAGDNYSGYYEAQYDSTLTVLDKENVIDSGEESTIKYPYARFVGRDNHGFEYKDIYFFDDCFVDSNLYLFRFRIDEYMDIKPIRPYENLMAGGMLRSIIKAVSDNFESSYKDYSNGKEVLMAVAKPAVKDALLAILHESFEVPANYGDFKSVSHALISLSGEVISGINIKLIYENGNINFNCKTNTEDLEIRNTIYAYNEVPSYFYHFLSLAGKYNFNEMYSRLGFDVKAEIEITNNNGYENLPNQFNCYSIENRSYYNTNPQRETTKVIESGNEKIYLYQYDYFSEKNGVVSRITYEDLKYGEYSAKFGDTQRLVADFLNSVLNQNCSFSITETANGYKIESEHSYSYYDYDGGGNEIARKQKVVHEVDKTFTKIFSTKYATFDDDQLKFTCNINFVYDFSLTIPSGVTNHIKY